MSILFPRCFKVLQPKSLVSRLYCSSGPKIEKTINSITLLGRIGADPQKRGTDQHPVVTFSLATHNNYKYESGDWAQRTDWHRIVVFKPSLRDTVMDFMKKGQRALVQGKITYGEITDTEGNQRTSTSIIADDIVFFRENKE
ncbi:single-stranded DNA-binding protein, mitochondrial [Condylostylus longicornis]|uniref:single-stranded DNA-binding protein, mitochondrial n=1 Tax=Condylostylus longicornis TaxID=2530218 RepID=UPI00244E373F|nr:single-stranded DNA-binding protein, mitochondrial [Condylostylus longicornis]